MNIFILFEFYIGQKPKDQAIKSTSPTIKDASLIFLEEKIR